ncbi:uncharacterized protein LOC111403426 [Olea europaea var. sylvestris]|uniref:uncharacterized protein LOC111403426 n=1 Tax=Olea europaea var. sylvestris TaxID=158386 RepID=UPI000C1D5507|nr:uncharacterized protein LOC111403426 [Olea europaea var. sylvestris]
MLFRSKLLLVLSGESPSVACTPKCSLCGELEFKSHLNYVSCEICGDWFHGDAFDLNAVKVEKLIGFKCHKCLNRSSPVCPHVCATESSKPALFPEINAGPDCTGKESTGLSPLDETFADQKLQSNEKSNDLFLIDDDHEKQSSVSILHSNQIQASDAKVGLSTITSEEKTAVVNFGEEGRPTDELVPTEDLAGS